MKRAAFLAALIPFACFGVPAPYPVTINSQSLSAPMLETYRANARTFRVQFVDGGTVANLTGLTTNDVFFSWSASATSASRVAASASIANATNGQVDFTLAAADLNYSQGRYLYECGISNSVVRQGVMTILGSPFGTGAGAISFGTNVNWSLINWTGLPDYITDAPANGNQYARRSNAWEVVTGDSDLTSLQTNIAARLSSNVWAAADSTTNYAKRSDGRLSPIYGIRNSASDGGHAAINMMDTAIDFRSTSIVHSVVRIYAGNATGTVAGSVLGIDLWNFGVSQTNSFSAGTRSPSIANGLHSATAATTLWWTYAESDGGTNGSGKYVFASPDSYASPIERMSLDHRGNLTASGNVAAAGFTLNGTNITSWSQVGGGGGSGTLTGAVVGAGSSSLLTVTNSGSANITLNLKSTVATNGQWNSATNDLIGAVAASNSFVRQSGGEYSAAVDWIFGDLTSGPWLGLNRTQSQCVLGYGLSTWLVVTNGGFDFVGGLVSCDGSGITSLRAANIASNTPIALGTGTVTAAGFIGNGAWLTNVPPQYFSNDVCRLYFSGSYTQIIGTATSNIYYDAIESVNYLTYTNGTATVLSNGVYSAVLTFRLLNVNTGALVNAYVYLGGVGFLQSRYTTVLNEQVNLNASGIRRLTNGQTITGSVYHSDTDAGDETLQPSANNMIIYRVGP